MLDAEELGRQQLVLVAKLSGLKQIVLANFFHVALGTDNQNRNLTFGEILDIDSRDVLKGLCIADIVG